jgi:hypothetical protein
LSSVETDASLREAEANAAQIGHGSRSTEGAFDVNKVPEVANAQASLTPGAVSSAVPRSC